MIKEEEAIERLKNLKEYGQEMLDDTDYVRPVDITIEQDDVKTIETVLNMLKEKDKEIERYKKLYEMAISDAVKTGKRCMDKDKIINKMAIEILVLDRIRASYEKDRPRIWETEEGIKQYFERKVEGSNGN